MRSLYLAQKEQVNVVKPRAVSLRATLTLGKRCARDFAHSSSFLLISRKAWFWRPFFLADVNMETGRLRRSLSAASHCTGLNQHVSQPERTRGG